MKQHPDLDILNDLSDKDIVILVYTEIYGCSIRQIAGLRNLNRGEVFCSLKKTRKKVGNEDLIKIIQEASLLHDM